MNDLPFQYMLRGQQLEYLDGDALASAIEQRDRDLEDFLGRVPVLTPYTPVVTGITVGTGGSITAFYQLSDGWCDVQIVVVFGTSGIAVGTGPTFRPPFPIALWGAVIAMAGVALYDATGPLYAADLVVLNPTTIEPRVRSGTGSMAQLSATAPFTWAVNDAMVLQFRYRVA